MAQPQVTFLTVDATDQLGSDTPDVKFATGAIGGALQPTQFDLANLVFGFGGDLRLFGAVFGFGGARHLYAVLVRHSNRTVYVYQSTNGGVSWLILDNANGPVYPNGFQPAWNFDGAHTITIAYQKVASPAPLFLRDFDLNTGLWGVDYAIAGQPTIPAFQTTKLVFPRPDGSRVVLTVEVSPPGAGSGAEYNVWDPIGGWTLTHADPAANMIVLPGWDPTKTFIRGTQFETYTDADGTIGIFWEIGGINSGPPNWTDRTFYQQIHPNNSLGTFFDFPGQGGGINNDLLVNIQGPTIGPPMLIQATNLIVLPIFRNTNVGNASGKGAISLYVGTPITNPTWVEMSIPGVDAAFPGVAPPGTIDGTLIPESAIAAKFDGTTIFIAWTIPDSTGAVDFARVRLAQTINLVNPALGVSWSDSTPYDMTTDGPAGFYPVAGPNAQAMTIPTLGWQDPAPLGPAPPPPAAVFTTGPMVAGVPIGGTFVLPWPRVKCDVNGLTRCIIVRDKRPGKRDSKRTVIKR
jgi:hypothetical protein